MLSEESIIYLSIIQPFSKVQKFPSYKNAIQELFLLNLSPHLINFPPLQFTSPCINLSSYVFLRLQFFEILVCLLLAILLWYAYTLLGTCCLMDVCDYGIIAAYMLGVLLLEALHVYYFFTRVSR